MLTRSRLRRGEGTLQACDPEAGRARQRRNMGDEDRNEEELNFRKTFYTMADRVERLFSRLERLEKTGYHSLEGQGSVHGDGGGNPPPSGNESPSSSSNHHNKNSGNASNKPFFKLDVKFDLPVYNGESNAEKLNNWIRQPELYCRIQQIM